MKRRRFLSTAFAGALAHTSHVFAATAQPPIIDSHIHLFDISRPQGVPWPPKNSAIYQSALPARFRKLAAPFGVVGAIEIECSPWLDDNQWVLDIAAKNPIIVGTVGDLEPGTPGFGKQLDRLHRNPLFRGIRYGNLWSRDLSSAISRAEFINDLKLLAAAGLVMDTANPDPELIRAVVRLSDRIPNLKVVVDHLPELTPPEDPVARKDCDADLHLLGQRPQVFAKVSGIVRKIDGRVPLDLDFYRDRLDQIWGTSARTGCFSEAIGRTAINGRSIRMSSASPRNSFQKKTRPASRNSFGRIHFAPTPGSSVMPTSHGNFSIGTEPR